MTKTEKQLFESLVTRVSNKWSPFLVQPEEYKDEWQEFYNLVFRLYPESEVLMKYEGTLFDMARR